MKKGAKVLFLLLGVMLMFSMVLAVQQTVQAANSSSPVNLLYSHISVNGICPDIYNFWGYIEVDKMPGTRKVTIDYASIYYWSGYWTWSPILPNSTATVDATYVGPAANNKEIWRFFLTQSFPNTQGPGATGFTPTFAFAVNYVVNGTTYTDNNLGKRYYTSCGVYPKYPYFILNTANIAFDTMYTSTDSTGTYLDGYLMCKNLGSPRTIEVKYSLDNGASYQKVNAAPVYPAVDVVGTNEPWVFKVKVPATLTKCIIASITYKVNGVTYVDNNFNNKYIINYPLTYPQL